MTGRFARVVLLVLGITASAHAQWKILSAESEAGRAGIEHQHVVVEDATVSQRVTLDFAVLSAKSTALRVVDNPDGQSLGAMMKRDKFVCGVNGGYFDTEFKPIGLRVANGSTFSPLHRARLITGILLQSDRGIDVVRVSEFSGTKKIIAAVQSGPFLVEGNKRIRGLNDSQAARRTFAGIATDDHAFLGVCSEVSLAELANVLATVSIVADSKIRRAMNLDGGSSSAFWFAREDGSAFSISGRKPVRDFVAVAPK
jgi:exopolysaccharide biosynthesis protein